MKDFANIKRLRTQSLLKELIGEALGSLDDPLLSGMLVNDVECKKGRYDAFVYLDKQCFSEQEQEAILARLKRCARTIQARCLAGLGMYRCPNLHFFFDDSLEKINRIETLFAQIKRDKTEQNHCEDAH